MHTRTHTHTHLCAYILAHTRTHSRAHKHTHLYTHIHTRAHKLVHTYSRTHTHTHTHTRTYTHTHTLVHVHSHTVDIILCVLALLYHRNTKRLILLVAHNLLSVSFVFSDNLFVHVFREELEDIDRRLRDVCRGTYCGCKVIECDRLQLVSPRSGHPSLWRSSKLSLASPS